jgi:anti-anti-sigma factor
VCILSIAGSLRAPGGGELRHAVHDLLRRGERAIVVDLAGVSRIDAAGVGQLVRAYNVTRAAHGTLQIRHAPERVRAMLERARLLGLLTGRRASR